MATTNQAELNPVYEARAPGWILCCRRCGFTEPYGKYGIRIGAKSRGKSVLWRCRSCNGISMHAVRKRDSEQVPQGVS